MSVTDWIISLAGSLIAILIAVSTYFLSKWIESVDETLKEQSQDIKDNTLKIVSLESKQDSQTANISEAVQSKLTAVQFPHSKIDKIEQEVCGLREVVQRKVLPQLERQSEEFGKVILVENQLKEQDKKMVKLFEILRILAQKH